MKMVFNARTGRFDLVGLTPEEAAAISAAYLKLDQTTPQQVDNGSPQFNEGITLKKDTYLYLDGA